MMRGLSIAALLVVVLAGCTSSKLSGQASGFGKLTLDAVAAQKLQLSAYAEEEAKDIAAELAESVSSSRTRVPALALPITPTNLRPVWC
ncbi:MAG: hypothetical protein ACOVO5_08925 [Devosia sp.]